MKIRDINRKKGLSTVEYSILIIIVLGALMTSQTYVKRALQGRYKDAADEIGDQYSPGNANYFRQTNTESMKNEARTGQAEITTILENEITSIHTLLEIVNVQQEYWGESGT